MRDSYREQLDDVLADLVHMAQVVSSAVRSATTALVFRSNHGYRCQSATGVAFPEGV